MQIYRHRFSIMLLLVFLSLAPRITFAVENSIQIAFLEDSCVSGRTNSYSTIVRLAFYWQDSAWKSFDHTVRNSQELGIAATKFAGTIKWVLAAHDRSLGAVTSKGVEKYRKYKDVGMQELVSTLPAAAKTSRDLTYAGSPGCPVRKPMVLSTARPKSDKERWAKVKATIKPSREMAEKIRSSADDRYAGDDNKPVNAAFTEKDLLVAVQYRSPVKGDLIALQVRPDARTKDAMGNPDKRMHWFYVDKNKADTFIGHGLVLIDWADYNSDAGTEFLFWVDGYNSNGYLITWADFSRSDAFTWTYH